MTQHNVGLSLDSSAENTNLNDEVCDGENLRRTFVFKYFEI